MPVGSLTPATSYTDADAVAAAKADGDIADAISEKHAQDTDQGLDSGGGNASTAADVKGAVDSEHTQGTDQGLDTGGPNASTAAQVKTAIDSEHTQGTDQGLDTGGPSAVTAAQTKSAFSHVSNDGSDHGFIDQDVTNGASPSFDVENISVSDGQENDIVQVGGDGKIDLAAWQDDFSSQHARWTSVENDGTITFNYGGNPGVRLLTPTGKTFPATSPYIWCELPPFSSWLFKCFVEDISAGPNDNGLLQVGLWDSIANRAHMVALARDTAFHGGYAVRCNNDNSYRGADALAQNNQWVLIACSGGRVHWYRSDNAEGSEPDIDAMTEVISHEAFGSNISLNNQKLFFNPATWGADGADYVVKIATWQRI